MIESITISDVATFAKTPETLDGLSKINFLFGSNGSGKTTISRVISDETIYQTCQVKWRAGTKLQPMVYNRDFVERHFNQSAEMKGVFTWGEDQINTLAKIDAAKAELDALTTKIETLSLGLHGEDGKGGKKGEMAALESNFRDKCWAQKQKHDVKLQGGFEGFRNSADKFKGKVLQEHKSNTATLLALDELEKKAASIFGPTPTTEPLVPAVDTSKLLAHETNPILTKRVIGKNDVDIAAMIMKLGSSDWVRRGREFYKANDQVCPFCQQETSDAFAKSLNEYFDETFLADSKAIDDLAANYASEAARIQQQIAAIIASPCKFLDVEKLKSEKELLDARITLNTHRIAEKKREASQVVEMESLSNVCAAINNLINSANAIVVEHNKIIANLDAERKTLTAQVWKFVLEELKVDLVDFNTKKDGLDKAITAITNKISEEMTNREKKTAEIRELEKQTTSIKPTMDGINSLLSSFGFQGFKLAMAANEKSYKLVRLDGSDAKATLSEGEKTFVTFLLFYHLLKGSESDTGMTTDRIVVFDDPVSSLDSDILFIVGSLIKGLFDEVRDGKGRIKQIFVLTHNVYFHKEVSYESRRKEVALKDETFWIVRRSGLISKLDKHPTNPIKTSYELLWNEVRKFDPSNITIQNTLRRILENYFKILGGKDFDDLCAMFDGNEKIICNSLCSWVHDGSHYALDDINVTIHGTLVDSYLKVFRAIFEKSGHLPHYKMMMGDAYKEEPVVVATPASVPASAPSPTA